MRQRFVLFSCSFFASILLLTACTKEGPQGETGPAGPQGPAGPTGATGPKGDTGTANVIYSNWTDVTFTEDAANGVWTGVMQAPKLTNDILTKGEIKVYLNLNTAAQPAIVPLPYFDGGTIINTIYQLQKINLISTDDVGTYTENNQKFLQYRYILIPGAVTGRKQTIDWNDYKQVQAYLGLKD